MCRVGVLTLVVGVSAGCEGDGSDVVSCTQTDEEGQAGEAYCFTGYGTSMGDGNDTCSSRGSCVGPSYGSSRGTDLAGTIFRAYARCSDGTYITCNGTLSAQGGEHGNGEKFVSCFGPGLSSDACW